MPDDAQLPEALADWATRPGPAKVIAAIRDRALAGHSTTTGPLRCALDPAERKDVGRLLGTPWVLSGRPVRLQDLAARLPGTLTPLSLAEAVHGTIVPRAHVRASAAAAAEAERARVLETLSSVDISETAARTWAADPGLPRPGSGELVTLAEATAEVWRSLSGTPIHLAELAATTRGDAHALDGDRRLGRSVARLAAAVHGLPRPSRAGREWRAAWRAVGVLCNEVSSRVLTLNLPLRGEALARAVPGEPLWLTLRSLSFPWSVTNQETVYVCENPTVVEAGADRHGPSCAPLVCTDGMPSTAALALVSGLAEAGCRILARADFDRAGMTVLDQLRTAAPGLELWRYDADTYTTALGKPVELDPARHGPIHEETILALLLADLDAG